MAFDFRSPNFSLPKTNYNMFNYPYGAQGATPNSYSRSYGVSGQQSNLQGALPKNITDSGGYHWDYTSNQWVKDDSGLPNDMMGMIKQMMAKFGIGGGVGGGTPMTPFQAPASSGMAQQYLQQIQQLMGKIGAGGLPALDPSSAQAIQFAKQAGMADINRNYEQAMGDAIARGFGAGIDRSSLSDFNRADLSGRKAQAVAELLGNLSNQEFGMRQGMAGLQQQGLMGQIGALQQMAQLAQSQDQQRYDQSRRDWEMQQQMQQGNQQNQMQMIQWLMSLMQQYGGGR